MTEMGDKIKALRKERGMTLEELGDKVGVGKSTVRKWENGMIENMRRDKIAKIAHALGVSPAYLMGWEATDFFAGPSVVTVTTPSPSAKEAAEKAMEEWHIERHLPEEERLVLRAYRKADVGTKAAVRKLLDVDYPVPLAAHAHDGATPDQLASDAEILRKAAEKK